MFATGLVIGKFLPPHRGHRLLIDTALEQAQHVDVLVCAHPSDPIPAARRAAWLRELHPAAQVQVIETVDTEDTKVWAENTIRCLGRPPAAVFTSGEVGTTYARLMGSTHVSVDPSHERVPCSGVSVRADPLGSWEFLEPCVRAYFVRRVCVLGAESTGTTTMALALATHYDTLWVPEYVRDYWVERHSRVPGSAWQTAEFVHIALEQARREDVLAREANRLLVCDTDAFAACLWHERYLGCGSQKLAAIAESRPRPDLYLLTDIDVPLEPNRPAEGRSSSGPLVRGLEQVPARDGEAPRRQMHERFCAQLERTGRRWALLSGTHEARTEKAVALVDALLRGD